MILDDLRELCGKTMHICDTIIPSLKVTDRETYKIEGIIHNMRHYFMVRKYDHFSKYLGELDKNLKRDHIPTETLANLENNKFGLAKLLKELYQAEKEHTQRIMRRAEKLENKNDQ